MNHNHTTSKNELLFSVLRHDPVPTVPLKNHGSGIQAAELIREFLYGFSNTGARIAHIKFLAEAPNHSKK